MLGWVITCHDDRAQELQDRLEEKHGPLAQCRAVNFWRGLSTNMLSRMMCEALHQADSGDGVIFLTDTSGAAPYRVASLMSHKLDTLRDILLYAISSEKDSLLFYLEMLTETQSETLKPVLREIIAEEKKHLYDLQALLEKLG